MITLHFCACGGCSFVSIKKWLIVQFVQKEICGTLMEEGEQLPGYKPDGNSHFVRSLGEHGCLFRDNSSLLYPFHNNIFMVENAHRKERQRMVKQNEVTLLC